MMAGISMKGEWHKIEPMAAIAIMNMSSQVATNSLQIKSPWNLDILLPSYSTHQISFSLSLEKILSRLKRENKFWKGEISFKRYRKHQNQTQISDTLLEQSNWESEAELIRSGCSLNNRDHRKRLWESESSVAVAALTQSHMQATYRQQVIPTDWGS